MRKLLRGKDFGNVTHAAQYNKAHYKLNPELHKAVGLCWVHLEACSDFAPGSERMWSSYGCCAAKIKWNKIKSQLKATCFHSVDTQISVPSLLIIVPSFCCITNKSSCSIWGCTATVKKPRTAHGPMRLQWTNFGHLDSVATLQAALQLGEHLQQSRLAFEAAIEVPDFTDLLGR